MQAPSTSMSMDTVERRIDFMGESLVVGRCFEAISAMNIKLPPGSRSSGK
jgi:hypothetical protein